MFDPMNRCPRGGTDESIHLARLILSNGFAHLLFANVLQDLGIHGDLLKLSSTTELRRGGDRGGDRCFVGTIRDGA